MTGYTFNQLFDFTRTTSATFVGSNGLIQTTPASVNLLTYTQEFDNAVWGNQVGGTGVACVTTANAGTAPDDTSTADRLQFSLAGGTSATDITRRRQPYNTPAGAHTFSIYLRSTDGVSSYNMHITDASGATNNITVTGSWQRFIVTATSANTTIYYSVGLRGGQALVNSNTADILAWGAQLELGSTLTTYTRNNGGLYPARFDYDPVTLAPKGILIEEQRTNLLLYSEQFDNAVWSKAAATVTTNATTSPDGTTNADKLVEDTSTAQHRADQTPVSSAGAQTFSVFVKAAEREFIGLRIGLLGCGFNLTNGATYALSAGVTAISVSVGNGWYRCSISVASASANDICRIGLAQTAGSLAPSYTGDGTSGVFLYGAQLELGAFPTSYIPTVASQVTRSLDICNIVAPMFTPWYNQTQGTFVVDAITSSRTTSSVVQETLIDVTSTVRAVRGASSVAIGWLLGSATFMSSGVTAASTVVKTAGGYSAGSNAASTNGAAVTTDAGSTYGTATQMSVGNIGGGSSLNGHIRSIKYYPFRASNNQLQVLST